MTTDMRLVSDDHGVLFKEQFSEMLATDFLCDLTVYVNCIEEQHSIRIHKLVISAVSPWFKSLVADCNQIMIQDIDEKSLKAVFSFAYTGELRFTPQNVNLLLATALKLQISSAVKLCGKYLSIIKAAKISDATVTELPSESVHQRNEESKPDKPDVYADVDVVDADVDADVYADVDVVDADVDVLCEVEDTKKHTVHEITHADITFDEETDHIYAVEESDSDNDNDAEQPMTKRIKVEPDSSSSLLMSAASVSRKYNLPKSIPSLSKSLPSLRKNISSLPKNIPLLPKSTPLSPDHAPCIPLNTSSYTSSHSCSICSATFTFYSQLVRHQTTHPVTFLHQCLTSRKYRPTSVFRMIAKIGSMYQCRKCLYLFRLYSKCRHHLISSCLHATPTTEHGNVIVRQMVCTTCDKQFVSQKMMRLHNLLHHQVPQKKPPQQWYCYHCDLLFNSKIQHQQHSAQHHAAPKLPKPETGSGTHSNVLISTGFSVNCPICNLIYMRKIPYLKHLEGHEADGHDVDYEHVYNVFGCKSQKVAQKRKMIGPMTESEKNGALQNISTALGCDLEVLKVIFTGDYTTLEAKFGITPFHCQKCKVSFTMPNRLASHLKLNHNTDFTYLPLLDKFPRKGDCGDMSCVEEGCEFECHIRSELYQHMRSQHPNKKYPCSHCKYTSSLHPLLVKHIADVHGNTVCDQCNKSFATVSVMKLHRVCVHNLEDPTLESYHCEYEGCEFKTYRKKTLTTHQNSKHSDRKKQVKCDICEKWYRSRENLICHMKTMHVEKTAAMPSIFKNGQPLEDRKQMRAIRKHQMDAELALKGPYVCDLCSKSFRLPASLKAHIQYTHKNEKSFACDMCTYQAKSAILLNKHKWLKHQMKSEGLKFFQCDHCGHLALSNSLLIHHQQIKHSDAKPFSCVQCTKSYSTKYQLSDHIRRSHAATKLRCSECFYTTTGFLAIKKHIISMHTHPNLKPYQCYYCDFTHAHDGCVHAHCKQRHKFDKPQSKQIIPLPEVTIPIYRVTTTPEGSEIVEKYVH